MFGHEYRIALVESGGVLTLKLDSIHSGRRVWVDGKRTRLEQRLADVLARLEVRAEQAEQRRREREHHARETELARQTEMAGYRADYAYDYAVGVLREQAAAWHLAEQIRALCAHIRQRHEADQPDIETWVAWALHHADHIDPTRRMPAIPEIPEPSARELERYRNAAIRLALEMP